MSGIYDFQTNGIGIGLRGYFPINAVDRLALSPQVSYFPSFNVVTEFYAGLAAQYTLAYVQNWDLYGLAAGYYDDWINYAKFDSKIARQNSFAGEIGGGIMRSVGCFHPFLEGRYDTRWKEAHIELGFLVTLGGGCFSLGHHGPDLCPAYF